MPSPQSKHRLIYRGMHGCDQPQTCCGYEYRCTCGNFVANEDQDGAKATAEFLEHAPDGDASDPYDWRGPDDY